MTEHFNKEYDKLDYTLSPDNIAIDALSILKEFTEDVEIAGEDYVEEDWPDIIVTYRKAKGFLDRLGYKG